VHLRKIPQRQGFGDQGRARAVVRGHHRGCGGRRRAGGAG